MTVRPKVHVPDAVLLIGIGQCQINSWCMRGAGHPGVCMAFTRNQPSAHTTALNVHHHEPDPRCAIVGCPYFKGHKGKCHGAEWRRRLRDR